MAVGNITWCEIFPGEGGGARPEDGNNRKKSGSKSSYAAWRKILQWPDGDNETLQYRYDGAGNRLQEAWDNGVTIDYRYLPGNYLAELDGVVRSERDNATVEYVYNARQQLAQVKHNDTVIAQFFYDALGRRIKAVEGNTTTITLYAGNDVVYEEKATSSTPTRKTCYLVVNGQYLAKTVQVGSNPPEKYFYHTDLVGSIRAITDMAGQVVASLTYEPFGRERSISGSTDPHRFTGKPLDNTELYYFSTRYYDPDLGRFIMRDPARDGLNWYVYCYANPLRFIDKNGLWGSDLHRKWTMDVASAIFGEAIAFQIAYGAWDCDGTSGRGPYPNINFFGIKIQGDLSYHFDMNPDPEIDSRLAHLSECTAKAKEYILAGYVQEGFQELGYGLHALQDYYAHEGGILGPFWHVLTEKVTFGDGSIGLYNTWDDPYAGDRIFTQGYAARANEAIEATRRELESFFNWYSNYLETSPPPLDVGIDAK